MGAGGEILLEFSTFNMTGVRLREISQLPDERYILVSSFANKGDLRRYLAEALNLPWRHKYQILRALFNDLKGVHRAGLVHRDLVRCSLWKMLLFSGQKH